MKVSDFISQGIGSLAPNTGISLVGHQEKDSSFGLDDLDVHQHIGYPKVQCELFHSILEAGRTLRNQSKQLPLSLIMDRVESEMMDRVVSAEASLRLATFVFSVTSHDPPSVQISFSHKDRSCTWIRACSNHFSLFF